MRNVCMWSGCLIVFVVLGSCLAAEETITISGTVVDPDGKPVEGARVECRSGDSSFEYEPPLLETSTGKAGTFSFENVERGSYLIVAGAEGYADAAAEWAGWQKQRTGPVELQLTPAAPVHGTVVDAEGQPIEGVQVTFTRYDGGERFLVRPITTAADGKFNFANGPLGRVTLYAKKDGYQWWYDEIGQAASRSRKDGVTITLTRCPVVTGVVTDAATGEPVPGATVYRMFPADSVLTDEDGRYTMVMHSGRAVRFAASAPGLSTRGLIGAVARDNEVTELNLALEPSAPITGKVVDSRTEQPIAGARVVVGLGLPPRDPDEPVASVLTIPGEEDKIEIPEGLDMMEVLQGYRASPLEAVTDAEGAFTIPLSFPEMVALRVSIDGYLEQSFQTEGDFSRQCLLKLDEGQVIAGRVVSPDGEPVAGIVVECRYGNLRLETTTGDDGRFRFSGLWARGYLLRADEEGRDGRGVLRGVVFGDERVLDDIELKLLDPMYVSGTITDKEGRPFTDCSVGLRWREGDTDSISLSRLTDGFVAGGRADVGPDGTYISTGLTHPGDYEVEVRRHDEGRKIAPKVIRVKPGEQVEGVDFVVRAVREVRAVEVSGQVVDEDGKPIPGAIVSVSDNGVLTGPEAKTSDDGAYVITGLIPGDVGLTAAAPGFSMVSVRVAAPDDKVIICLEPEPSGALRIRVVDAKTREPIEDYYLRSLSPHCPCGSPYHLGDDHPDGVFEAHGLAAGGYKYEINHPGYASVELPVVEIETGAPIKEILVELDQGATVTVKVVSAEDGTPIARALVAYCAGLSLRELTGADGTLVVPRCGAGEHTVDVEHRRYAPAEVAFTLEKGETEKTVTVELEGRLSVSGRVVSAATSAPVAGADVEIRCSDPYEHDEHKGRTDAEGRFVIRGVLPGTNNLTVEHPEFVRESTTEEFGTRSRPSVTVKMSVGGTVYGRVTTADGEPIAGRRLYLPGGASDNDDVVTNEDGSYECSHVAPGLHIVGIGNCFDGYRKLAEVAEGERVRVDFVLGRAAVFGALTVDGDPVYDYSSMDIELKQGPRTGFRAYHETGRPDENGRYRIEGVPPGRYVWRASTKVSEDVRLYKRGEIQVGHEDVELNVDFSTDAFDEAANVSGVAVDRSGAPVQAADVRLEHDCSAMDVTEAVFVDQTRSVAWTTVYHDGSFVLRDIKPGRYVLRVYASGYREASVPIEKREGASLEGVEVRLARPAEVERGSVIVQIRPWVEPTETGRPRFIVGDGMPFPPYTFYFFDEVGRRQPYGYGEIELRDGGYVIDLPPGRHRIVARLNGYALLDKEVEVVAGKETRLDLEFSRGFERTVTVTDTSGNPLADAFVMLDSGKGQHLAIVPRDYSMRSDVGLTSIRGTDLDGRVVLQRVGDGEYTLRVRRAGYQEADVPVHVAGSDEEITVTLQPSAD